MNEPIPDKTKTENLLEFELFGLFHFFTVLALSADSRKTLNIVQKNENFCKLQNLTKIWRQMDFDWVPFIKHWLYDSQMEHNTKKISVY